MRHVVRSNDWTALLNTLNALAAASSRQPSSGEQSAARTAESWVERISKERWTTQKSLAVASAVVGVGAILYGARTLLAHDKGDWRNR
jgi:hypothetical protein